mmetsp:Transcript_3374/g.10475  ORF Transcript_3374/g.10475 Transcript_3374/m.10475 type:complete len:219 (+) Transcript_3374:606-1262(+)
MDRAVRPRQSTSVRSALYSRSKPTISGPQPRRAALHRGGSKSWSQKGILAADGSASSAARTSLVKPEANARCKGGCCGSLSGLGTGGGLQLSRGRRRGGVAAGLKVAGCRLRGGVWAMLERKGLPSGDGVRDWAGELGLGHQDSHGQLRGDPGLAGVAISRKLVVDQSSARASAAQLALGSPSQKPVATAATSSKPKVIAVAHSGPRTGQGSIVRAVG